MPYPSHPPWFDHSNYTWRRVKVMKLLIMQFGQCRWKNDLLNMYSRHVKYISKNIQNYVRHYNYSRKKSYSRLSDTITTEHNDHNTASILTLLVASMHNIWRHASTAKSSLDKKVNYYPTVTSQPVPYATQWIILQYLAIFSLIIYTKIRQPSTYYCWNLEWCDHSALYIQLTCCDVLKI
jgi:hypothetical protein